jgi:hypothetical protein
MLRGLPVAAAFAVATLGGCAKSSTIPLAADTLQITASAARACGRAGAQEVAVRRAAVETIQRGYDKFLVIGGGYQSNLYVAGYTPVSANTYGTGSATRYGNSVYGSGYSTTTFTGGQPIIAGSHDQGLVVKMFKDGDPAGSNAVPARETLGPKWKEAVANGPDRTC